MPAQSSFLHRARLCLTCCSIAANALFAGGIFTFPLLAPTLALHLKLTQPQLTTIVLAGMIGQYPFSIVVGMVIDRFGPWACSLVSSILFSSGFGLFAWEIANTPGDVTPASRSSFHRLTIFFCMAGLGTVFSYFSSLFAASKNFPKYIGVASGSSMALFGLSPLFLSLVASRFFSDPATGLNVTKFLTFHAATAGLIHLIGAFNLRIPSAIDDSASSIPEVEEFAYTAESDVEDLAQSDERAPFLPKKSTDANVQVILVEEDATIFDLLKDVHFWILALIIMLVLGLCEMVISNIGTIVLSLPASSSADATTFDSSTDVATSTQVRILSIANTVSRLLAGPLADFISPVASYLPSGVRSFPRKHFISRIAFLTSTTVLLGGSFALLQTTIRSQQDIWILSVGTGMAYGITFTILSTQNFAELLSAMKKDATPRNKEIKDIVDYVSSRLPSLFNQSLPSDKFCDDVDALLRQSFSRLYQAIPALSLRLSIAIFTAILNDKVIPAFEANNFNAQRIWERIAQSTLSGVLDHLDENDNEPSKRTIAQAFYTNICAMFFFPSFAIPSTSFTVSLRVHAYMLLSNTSQSYSVNQALLRKPDVLGSENLGRLIAETKDYLALEQLLVLLARLIPSTNNTSNGRKLRTRFLREVFMSAPVRSRHYEDILKITEHIHAPDWEETSLKIVEVLARDITFPQPFEVKEVIICDVSFLQPTPHDRLFIDRNSFLLNHVTEDDVYESVQVLYSSVRQIKVSSTSNLVQVAMSSPAMIGDRQMDGIAEDASMMTTFELLPSDIGRFVQAMKARNLRDFAQGHIILWDGSSLSKSTVRMSINTSPARLDFNLGSLSSKRPSSFEEKVKIVEQVSHLHERSDDSTHSDIRDECSRSEGHHLSTAASVNQTAAKTKGEQHADSPGDGIIVLSNVHDRPPVARRAISKDPTASPLRPVLAGRHDLSSPSAFRNVRSIGRDLRDYKDSVLPSEVTRDSCSFRRTHSQVVRDTIFGASDEDLSDISEVHSPHESTSRSRKLSSSRGVEQVKGTDTGSDRTLPQVATVLTSDVSHAHQDTSNSRAKSVSPVKPRDKKMSKAQDSQTVRKNKKGKKMSKATAVTSDLDELAELNVESQNLQIRKTPNILKVVSESSAPNSKGRISVQCVDGTMEEAGSGVTNVRGRTMRASAAAASKKITRDIQSSDADDTAVELDVRLEGEEPSLDKLTVESVVQADAEAVTILGDDDGQYQAVSSTGISPQEVELETAETVAPTRIEEQGARNNDAKRKHVETVDDSLPTLNSKPPCKRRRGLPDTLTKSTNSGHIRNSDSLVTKSRQPAAYRGIKKKYGHRGEKKRPSSPAESIVDYDQIPPTATERASSPMPLDMSSPPAKIAASTPRSRIAAMKPKDTQGARPVTTSGSTVDDLSDPVSQRKNRVMKKKSSVHVKLVEKNIEVVSPPQPVKKAPEDSQHDRSLEPEATPMALNSKSNKLPWIQANFDLPPVPVSKLSVAGSSEKPLQIVKSSSHIPSGSRPAPNEKSPEGNSLDSAHSEDNDNGPTEEFDFAPVHPLPTVYTSFNLSHSFSSPGMPYRTGQRSFRQKTKNKDVMMIDLTHDDDSEPQPFRRRTPSSPLILSDVPQNSQPGNMPTHLYDVEGVYEEKYEDIEVSLDSSLRLTNPNEESSADASSLLFPTPLKTNEEDDYTEGDEDDIEEPIFDFVTREGPLGRMHKGISSILSRGDRTSFHNLFIDKGTDIATEEDRTIALPRRGSPSAKNTIQTLRPLPMPVSKQKRWTVPVTPKALGTMKLKKAVTGSPKSAGQRPLPKAVVAESGDVVTEISAVIDEITKAIKSKISTGYDDVRCSVGAARHHLLQQAADDLRSLHELNCAEMSDYHLMLVYSVVTFNSLMDLEAVYGSYSKCSLAALAEAERVGAEGIRQLKSTLKEHDRGVQAYARRIPTMRELPESVNKWL
ncbi:hypothetical protein EW146_g962 [Bondarzewia mesenterica]|uniref:Uncharacterized protein n=1 Tax=Bondarzewia mesenterica TaxID=1095465 RepID=A0A4S4M5B6_9AGAM|nr:hypothetical protein EW146_g962 [Bondarzewia mesenterica]